MFPLKPALRPDRVTAWNGGDVEGSAVGKGTFFINSALPFPLSASQLLYCIQCHFWWYIVGFFLGDLSINENQCLQGCFYFAVNTIPLFPSCHFGTVKRPCIRNILHIFSVWVPSNCNSNKCRSQYPPSKLHQFPYNNLLPVGKSVLFLTSILYLQGVGALHKNPSRLILKLTRETMLSNQRD